MTTIKELEMEIEKEQSKKKPDQTRITDLENYIEFLKSSKAMPIFLGTILSLSGLGLMFLIPYWYGLLIGAIPTIIGAGIICKESLR